MDENFLKFKKRVWLHILIKCIAAGVAAGLLAVLAVLLPCKLYGVNLLWILYILIFLGGAAVGGGVAFLFLRTDDKKIAMRLDSELNLHERVQTSLTYGNKNGAMYELQKADTSAVLGAISLKSLVFTNVLISVLCISISVVCIVAVPVVATTVPPVFAQKEEQPYDPPREITDWEWAALDELIDYVNDSKKIDSFTKAGMVSHLRGLKTVLLSGVSQSTLPTFVQNTVTEIRNTVKDAADQGISDEQKALNSEEEAYVIAKLYEIFSISQPTEGGDDPVEGGDPNDENGNESGGKPGVGPGNLNINQMPFFDPYIANSKDENGNYLNGEVLCGESRAEYYERVQQALKEGTISREEWEYIMVTYFGDLSGNED